MNQKPLPDDFEARAVEQRLAMEILHKDVGIPMEKLRKCDLQGLYDFLVKSVPRTLRDKYRNLVVIEKETVQELVRDLHRTVAHLRPDRKNVPHNIELMARRDALGIVPYLSKDASLQNLETALKTAGRSNSLVIEDADYDDYGIRANRIISKRPHGRSHSVVGEDPQKHADRLDEEIAETFMTALVALTLASPRSSQQVNARSAVHVCTEVGNESAFASIAEKDDVVVLAFEPGRERDGPANIAIYEKRDGEVKFWPRCSPWCNVDGSNFIMISEDCEAGFVFAMPSLLKLDKPSSQDLRERIEIGRMVLKRTARSSGI